MDSPFDSYVKDLYARRMKAKLAGNTVSAYIFKLLLNSLYGRLAISPDSDITIILNDEDSHSFMKHTKHKDVIQLGKDINIINYTRNIFDNRGPWQPPMNTCPQMSAAITAYARMKMYPFISREDCHYTDTDSVILSQPLPEECVSETELGMFKQEYGGLIRKGYFMAPKCYLLILDRKKMDADGREVPVQIVKYKGAPKGLVSPDFFIKQIDDFTHSEELTYESCFRINFKKFTIHKIDSKLLLRMNSKKRRPIFNDKNKWVGTKAIRFRGKVLTAQLAESTRSGIILEELAMENVELQKRLNGVIDKSDSDLDEDD